MCSRKKGTEMSNIVERITVSRDTPFAQMRFAEAARDWMMFDISRTTNKGRSAVPWVS